MSNWSGWAGVAVSLLAVLVSIAALRDARSARKNSNAAKIEAARAERQGAVNQLLNQHDIRRSQWDPWGFSEFDLAGMRRSIADWRDLCLQQMNILERDSPAWFVVKDLAERANDFSRETDQIAQRGLCANGWIEVKDGKDSETVKAAADKFQLRTRELVSKLSGLKIDDRSSPASN